MNSTAYALWDRIKKNAKMEGCSEGVINLNGTLADVRAANELANAGFIRIVRVNKYMLKYVLPFEI